MLPYPLRRAVRLTSNLYVMFWSVTNIIIVIAIVVLVFWYFKKQSDDKKRMFEKLDSIISLLQSKKNG